MDGSSQVNGQYPVWKAAALRPADEKTLIEESKTDQLTGAELHAVILAVMEEVNSGKQCLCLDVYWLKDSG